MSDRDAFLAAIADRQGDPLARQQFADWLEDEGRDPVAGVWQRILAEPDRDDLRLAWADMVGGERGEFVRLQVELAHIEHDGCTPVCSQECGHRDGCRGREISELRGRVGKLWVPNREQWFLDDGPFASISLYRGGEVPQPAGIVTRGFVSTVTLSWADWLAHHAALLNAVPLRGVRRERACEECGGHGYRLHGHAATWPRDRERRPCPDCRGTGGVAAWVGGGKVVLTVAPTDDECIEHGAEVLAGWPSMWTFRTWPGVEFELPAARGVTVDLSALTGEEVAPVGAVLRPGVVFGFGGRP